MKYDSYSLKKSSNPDIIELKRSLLRSSQRLILALFVAAPGAGLMGFMLTVLYEIYYKSDPDTNNNEGLIWLTFMMGFSSLLIGIFIAFSKKTLFIDRVKKMIFKRVFLLSKGGGKGLPKKGRNIPIGGCTAVWLYRDIKWKKGAFFPVSLTDVEGKQTLILAENSDYEESLDIARQVSGFLNLPLMDDVRADAAEVSAGSTQEAPPSVIMLKMHTDTGFLVLSVFGLGIVSVFILKLGVLAILFPLNILPLIGYAFITTGMYQAFNYSILRIDRRRSLITRSKCFSFTGKREDIPVLIYNSINIKEIKGSKSTSYFIGFSNPEKWSDLGIETDDHHEARLIAEQIALSFNLSYHDSTTGMSFTPEYLKQIAGSYTGIAGARSVILPQRPKKIRCKLSEKENKTIIDIPARGFLIKSFFKGVFIFLGISVFLNLNIPLLRLVPWSYRIHAYSTLFVLVFIPIIILEIRAMTGPARVTVSHEALEVELGSGKKRRSVRIPAAGIKEIALPPRYGIEKMVLSGTIPAFGKDDLPRQGSGKKKQGIIIRSAAESVEVGRALAEDECRYIHAVILNALFAPEQKSADASAQN